MRQGMSNSVRRGEPYKKKNRSYLRFQYAVAYFLERFPSMKGILLRCNSSIYKVRSQVSGRWLADRSGEFEVDKIFWIDPEKIVYCSLQEFSSTFHKGMIIGGDWDRPQIKFDDLDVFVSFKEHFDRGVPWKDTVFHKNVMEEIGEGRYLWGCRSESDFVKRCEKLDHLYEKIKTNGYKLQSELAVTEKISEAARINDEIAVNVGRHGDLLFTNGAHRLSIVKLLKLKRIPIKIVVRHPEWVALRKRYLLSPDKEHDAENQALLDHPDLSNTSNP
jgi:hypothetical protein